MKDATTPSNERRNDYAIRHSHGTGVVLFSSAGQLLFMNHVAQNYIRQLQPFTTKESGICLLPEDIHAVVRELISRLLQCDHPEDCEGIQVKRICFGLGQGLLLRGLCIPDEPLVRSSRLLIIMEQLNQKLECPNAKIQQQYHLTEREQMVIIYLMLGFTNKEIANRLNLSEYTVKEHLKRIMQKTKTTTRTGLLARIVFPSPQAVIPESLISGESTTVRELPAEGRAPA